MRTPGKPSIGNLSLHATLMLAWLCTTLSGCAGGGGGGAGGTSVTPTTYSVAVTVSGLKGSGLVRMNNNTDANAITGNGSFSFATALKSASHWRADCRTTAR